MNTFASMAVTYAVSTIFCIIAYFISAKDKNLIHEFRYANWATVVRALFYHEVVNLRKVFSVAICLFGLWFINK